MSGGKQNNSASDKKEGEKIAAPQKKQYTLKAPVSIDGKLKKAGEKVMLTEEGRIAFKRKHRI